jgi:hypothetical protein
VRNSEPQRSNASSTRLLMSRLKDDVPDVAVFKAI